MVQRIQALSNSQALVLAGGVFTLFAALPFLFSVYAYLIVGQAHLLQTLLHQIRAGKVTTRYLFVAGISFILVTGYLLFSSAFEPLLLIIALMFALHSVYGEYKLRGETLDRANVLFGAGAVSVLWAVVAGTVLPYVALLNGLLVFGLCCMAGRIFLAGPLLPGEQFVLVIVGASLFIAYVAGVPGNVFGALITLHVLNWTMYGSALAKTQGTLLRYWSETAALFFLTGAGFVLYALHAAPLLKYFFDPLYYYAWSVGHIILTSTLIQQNGISRLLVFYKK